MGLVSLRCITALLIAILAPVAVAAPCQAESPRQGDEDQKPNHSVRRPIDDLAAIREHLLLVGPETRRNLRFVTLTHLANNRQNSQRDLRMVRAAVSKLLNSLSWKPNIVLPQTVAGTNDNVLVIDLRDLGWTNSREWLRIIDQYPYGLKYDYVDDAKLKQIAIDLRQLSGVDVAMVRADWLVFAAASPQLYHALLRLPANTRDLERLVGVDVQRNQLEGDAARAGFSRSGISRQNRLVERHESKYGAYWVSYDFMPRKGRGDLVRFPLGPKFAGNPFNRHAFEHDGGESIFHLPNGLQAYFLADGKGARLDGAAHPNVVFDPSAIAGTPAIVNGLSCIHCHREGMVGGFRDEIRDAGALVGSALKSVRRLYVDPAQMDRLVAQDRKQFLTALRAATGPFIQRDEDEGRTITDFAEPIGHVVQRYLTDLGPLEVALELGLSSVDDLKPFIQHDRDLRKLGLGTLLQTPPGTIKRPRWEAIDGTSFFQDVATEIRAGTPILPGTTLPPQRRLSGLSR